MNKVEYHCSNDIVDMFYAEVTARSEEAKGVVSSRKQRIAPG